MAEITRDALLTRRVELAEQEKLAWANLNAVLGAIQDVDHWLAVSDEPLELNLVQTLSRLNGWPPSLPDADLSLMETGGSG